MLLVALFPFDKCWTHGVVILLEHVGDGKIVLCDKRWDFFTLEASEQPDTSALLPADVWVPMVRRCRNSWFEFKESLPPDKKQFRMAHTLIVLTDLVGTGCWPIYAPYGIQTNDGDYSAVETLAISLVPTAAWVGSINKVAYDAVPVTC